jgi:hypothetical protein
LREENKVIGGIMKDSGERQQFESGAVRDTTTGKGRFDLISPEMLFRLTKWLEAGASKYDDRNWEKGMPISRCVDCAMRHLVKYLDGWDDEDHLAAVVTNVMFIMYFEENKPELQDLPKWQDKIKQERIKQFFTQYASY